MSFQTPTISEPLSAHVMLSFCALNNDDAKSDRINENKNDLSCKTNSILSGPFLCYPQLLILK